LYAQQITYIIHRHSALNIGSRYITTNGEEKCGLHHIRQCELGTYYIHNTVAQTVPKLNNFKC